MNDVTIKHYLLKIISISTDTIDNYFNDNNEPATDEQVEEVKQVYKTLLNLNSKLLSEIPF